MKLYTEEEIKKAIYLAHCNTLEEVLEQLTPIELPNYAAQLDRIEKLLISEEVAKRNRFKIGPL